MSDTAKEPEFEVQPVSALTRRALQILKSKYEADIEAIAVDALVVEGRSGWRLDSNLGAWFRPKSAPKENAQGPE